MFFLPAGEKRSFLEEPVLESELDKRGLVGAGREVQQEAEDAQEVHSDAEDTAE